MINSGTPTQRSPASPDAIPRAPTRSSPRKPSLSTRMAGTLGPAQSSSVARLEPLTVQDSGTVAATASVSPLLARSLSRPKKENTTASSTPSQGTISASLPRTLKLTPSPSPPPAVPLEQSASVERQQALERKAAFLTAQIKTRQQQQHQNNNNNSNVSQNASLHTTTTSTPMGHILHTLPENAAHTGANTPCGELSLPTAADATNSTGSNVLTLDPTLHQRSERRNSGSPPEFESRLAVAGGSSARAFGERATEDDDAEAPFRANVLTDEVLRDWTGWEDLPLVLSAEFRIDATKMIGLDQLGTKLPQLSSLKLNKSRVPQIRLLGTKFYQLKYLWLNNCRLEGLRGIGSCAPRLEELYASFNRLTDLSPLLDVSETLRVLDVEGNDVADVKMLSFVLPALRRVTSLTLQMNPVEADPGVQVSLQQLEASTEGALAAAAASAPPVPRAPGPDADHVGDDDDSDVDALDRTESEDDVTAGEKQLLALRAWVALMMPQLVYFDDIAMNLDDELDVGYDTDAGLTTTAAVAATALSLGGPRDTSTSPDCKAPAGTAFPTTAAVAAATPASPLPGTSPARQAGKAAQAKIRSTYVDPMDHALAEELRLVRECIRDTEFDMLDQTLEAVNGNVYSRPATSCEGAVPRSRPGSRLCTASGLAGRLGGVAAAAVPVGRLGGSRVGSGGAAADAASSLTTGDTFAGSAIASLRRRLSPAVTPVLNTISPPPSLSGRLSLSRPSSSCEQSPLMRDRFTDRVSSAERVPSLRLDSAARRDVRGTAADNEASLDNMALFDDDDDEDWERFKSSLLAHNTYSHRPSSRRPCDDLRGGGELEMTGLGAAPPQLVTYATPAAATPTVARSRDHDDQQQRYHQLKLRMAAAAGDATPAAEGVTTTTATAMAAIPAVESEQVDAKDVDDDGSGSTGASLNDEGLSTALSRPSSGAATLRVGSASLSQQHMLSGLSVTPSTSRAPRTSLRVVPMSGSSRRMSLPRSAGSQDRPNSCNKSIGPEDSDDGFEGTLKSELLHARSRLARSHAPYAGEDILPDE